MTIPEIIEALTPYTGKFPEQAVREAMAQPEAITPHLLSALEAVANDPESFANDTNNMLHVFAIHLLAQFREKRAYPLLVKILMAPDDVPDDLFGDTLTEGLNRLLASVYSGDPEPLKRLVEGEDINEWVRGAAIDSFLVLASAGLMSREEVVSYYQSLFRGKLKGQNENVWAVLAGAVADLPAPELVEDLRKAYEEGLVEEGMIGFEEAKEEALTPTEKKPEWKRKAVQLIGDTVSEMEWWAAFHEEDTPRFPEPEYSDSLPGRGGFETPAFTPPAAPTYSPAVPLVRAEPKIGRNDPCPCGSGKKYKKCCGASK